MDISHFIFVEDEKQWNICNNNNEQTAAAIVSLLSLSTYNTLLSCCLYLHIAFLVSLLYLNTYNTLSCCISISIFCELVVCRRDRFTPQNWDNIIYCSIDWIRNVQWWWQWCDRLGEIRTNDVTGWGAVLLTMCWQVEEQWYWLGAGALTVQ